MFEQAHAKVAEIVDNLEMFATGGYLKESEKEFWDQPFDPAVLPELRERLESYLHDLSALAAQSSSEGDDRARLEEAASALSAGLIEDLTAFNARHADAVIEPEEQDEIFDLVQDCLAEIGVEAGQLPEFGE